MYGSWEEMGQIIYVLRNDAPLVVLVESISSCSRTNALLLSDLHIQTPSFNQGVHLSTPHRDPLGSRSKRVQLRSGPRMGSRLSLSTVDDKDLK